MAEKFGKKRFIQKFGKKCFFTFIFCVVVLSR